MGIPIPVNFCRFASNLERCKPHKAAHQPTICDVINDVKLFSTVYRRIYCRKFLMLSYQTSRNKTKCIKIVQCLQNVLVQRCRKPIFAIFLSHSATFLQPSICLDSCLCSTYQFNAKHVLTCTFCEYERKVNYLLQIQNFSETS